MSSNSFQNDRAKAELELAGRFGNSLPCYIKEEDGAFLIVSRSGKPVTTSFGTKDQAIQWARDNGCHLLGPL